MSRCACGAPIPDGFVCCEWCEPVGDADPLPLDPEDVRLNAMDQEAWDYADVFGQQEVT